VKSSIQILAMLEIQEKTAGEWSPAVQFFEFS
jgi:hypothetical protein